MTVQTTGNNVHIGFTNTDQTINIKYSTLSNELATINELDRLLVLDLKKDRFLSCGLR